MTLNVTQKFYEDTTAYYRGATLRKRANRNWEYTHRN